MNAKTKKVEKFSVTAEVSRPTFSKIQTHAEKKYQGKRAMLVREILENWAKVSGC